MQLLDVNVLVYAFRRDFPEHGREVPEYARPDVREVIVRPYRIVYRLVAADEVHILTVHHGARLLRVPAADSDE